MVFVDLEKAYDTREVLWRCMRKQNIPEGYIRLVQDMYQGASTRMKSKRGMSKHFEVGIGLHKGSALSPFLFIMLVDTISQDVRTELPWELLYADDLAIIDITSVVPAHQTSDMSRCTISPESRLKLEMVILSTLRFLAILTFQYVNYKFMCPYFNKH